MRTALEPNVVQSESNIEYDHDNSSNIVQSESTKHSQEENSLPSDANDVAVDPIYETVADMKPPVMVDEDSAHNQQEQGISYNVNSCEIALNTSYLEFCRIPKDSFDSRLVVETQFILVVISY